MEPPREKDKYSPILLSIYLLLLFLNILEIFDFIPLQIILLISKSPIKWEAVVALELVLSFYHRRCRRLHRLLPHHPMASAVPVRSALVRWPSELEWLIFRCPRQHWNAQDVNQPILSSVTSTITASLSLATFARLVEGKFKRYKNNLYIFSNIFFYNYIYIED